VRTRRHASLKLAARALNGTRGRQILCHDDLPPDYAAALARAYNDWAADYCKTDPQRLKFAAQIAMHDVPTAVEEARRCVKELGAVAVIGTPNPVNGQHLHDDVCEPLWDEIERLDVPIGFHPTDTTALKDDAGARYVGHANFHPIAHAIRNPVELMGALASLTSGGVLDRHPKLRCAFLEGTAGWLCWWLWRLDDQWEKFGPGCERQISMLPTDYFRRQCYVALDVDEEPAVGVVMQSRSNTTRYLPYRASGKRMRVRISAHPLARSLGPLALGPLHSEDVEESISRKHGELGGNNQSRALGTRNRRRGTLSCPTFIRGNGVACAEIVERATKPAQVAMMMRINVCS
jgi:Amidohydrolase